MAKSLAPPTAATAPRPNFFFRKISLFEKQSLTRPPRSAPNGNSCTIPDNSMEQGAIRGSPGPFSCGALRSRADDGNRRKSCSRVGLRTTSGTSARPSRIGGCSSCRAGFHTADSLRLLSACKRRNSRFRPTLHSRRSDKAVSAESLHTRSADHIRC